MKGKLSPVIIVVLVVVAVALGALVLTALTGNSTKNNDNKNIEQDKGKPVLNLSKDTDGDKPQKVTITAYATTTDKDGIKEIILPNGESVMGSTAKYEVEENGTYKFTARCVNGQTDHLSIDVTEIPENSYNNPYVPKGFTVVNDEGDTDVNDGFVIQDEYGNQYVWVPVESGKLSRKTMLDVKYEETSTVASALVNSVAKYYGFYIGRFEASQYEKNGKMAAASMAGKVPWTNITYQDATEYATDSAKFFGYEDCYTGLINSYAWDTTLAWIDTKEEEYPSYSSSLEYGNYSGTIYPTGITEKDEVNHICDLAGNVREWTTEIYKDNNTDDRNKDDLNVISRVIRGGGATLDRTPASHQGYPESQYEPYWGFRMVLYK